MIVTSQMENLDAIQIDIKSMKCPLIQNETCINKYEEHFPKCYKVLVKKTKSH